MHHLVIVVSGTPDRAKEVGGSDIVRSQKLSVASATEHNVGIKFSAEFATGFHEDARKPDKPSELFSFSGKFFRFDLVIAEFTIHFPTQVVAANTGDHHGSGQGRLSAVAEILDEVEKLAWLVADRGEKGRIGLVVVAGEIFIAASILGEATLEKFDESGVPLVVIHRRKSVKFIC